LIFPLEYLRAGLSVIPIQPGSKKPLVPWAEFQRRRATEVEVWAWWGASPRAGVGIVCGQISSVVVLDEDPRNGGNVSLASYADPLGPVVHTGGGGRHFYFAAPGDAPVQKIAGLLPGVDVQGDGSYVIAPPSLHPETGRAYAWAPGRALGAVALLPMPLWLRTLIQTHQQRHVAVPGRRAERAPAPFDLDVVLSRLRGVRRHGAGWTACCPVHDDREPSLSIGIGAGGHLLLYCFAGCRYAAIRDALELATGRIAVTVQ
jgi:hypothetical protein